MKNSCLFFLLTSLIGACTPTEKRQDTVAQTQSETASTKAATPKTDSATAPVDGPRPTDCQSVLAADKLNKPNTYQESAKPLIITLTLNQDSSQVTTPERCYFNNNVTVQAMKRSGKPAFKRTLLKDDLVYFVKTDDEIIRSVLQNVMYKPTFNGQKYITLVMQLIDPTTQRKAEYTLFMNYFGEILKVR